MARPGAYPINVRQALDAFSGACREKGLSVTHQRLAVYEALVSRRSHPAAEEIYQAVKVKCPTISRGTVYRTLETLCDIGLVADVNRVRGTARFEATIQPHHHLICLGCRKIMDVHDTSLDRLGEGAARRAVAAPPAEEFSGFTVTGYQVQLVGYCRQCRSPEDRHGRPQRVGTGRNSKEEKNGQGTQGHEDTRKPEGSVRR